MIHARQHPSHPPRALTGPGIYRFRQRFALLDLVLHAYIAKLSIYPNIEFDPQSCLFFPVSHIILLFLSFSAASARPTLFLAQVSQVYRAKHGPFHKPSRSVSSVSPSQTLSQAGAQHRAPASLEHNTTTSIINLSLYLSLP